MKLLRSGLSTGVGRDSVGLFRRTAAATATAASLRAPTTARFMTGLHPDTKGRRLPHIRKSLKAEEGTLMVRSSRMARAN
jgi:hypothetical protein